ncbi:hypothetical protein CP49_18300 [Bradyrhizobium valentinum]|uniref:C4-dicarboxylate transporter n=1 Tax=Bradyrhizobium valentinum TaxID=1518501 RepID=A0A0R3M1Y8_9BRAD|nr:hypothetical protein CP49_18300 [Bradyrhizobium valentinum]
MSEGRALTNLIGNGVATVVVRRMTDEELRYCLRRTGLLSSRAIHQHMSQALGQEYHQGIEWDRVCLPLHCSSSAVVTSGSMTLTGAA